MADTVIQIMPVLPDAAGSAHVRVNLLGRYMLADHREFPCQVVDMSPYRLRVAAPVCGTEGERVVLYADVVGRLEGTIDQALQNGFCLTLVATARKRDKLAQQLAALAEARLPARPDAPLARPDAPHLVAKKPA